MLNHDALERIRTQNFSDLLEVMREIGTCSLSQITERMDVGLTTVKKCVEDGVKCGMILTGEAADSTGGRKAQQFLINPEYQYYLLIITDNNDLVCRIYDFNKRCVESTKKQFAMPEYYPCLCNVIDSFFFRYKLGTVCLALPCVVKNGCVVDWYYNPKLQGFNIRKALEKRFGIHIIIQNDMKLTALGAASHQKGEPIQNLVTAQFGHNGIGVGEIVNGYVLEGYSGFAGEVGYTQDVRKNIMGTTYLAKIVRSIIICINPQTIIFYHSQRQNHFDKIFQEAVRGLPDYAIPDYIVSDAYQEDILFGFFKLIDKNGFFRKIESRTEHRLG